MIKAVVFDLDDTLISELDYVKSGYQCIAKYISNKFEYDEYSVYEMLIRLFNESPFNVFNRMYDALTLEYSEKDIQELVFTYRNHTPQITLYSDVIPFLEELHKEGIKTGIITDGYAVAQRKKLEAIKASNLFNEIIVTDELGREYWKPHPKSFEMMKEKLQVEFEEMIYIGDNPTKDFYIGCKYPINTVRIKRKNGIHKDKEYFGSVMEITSVNYLNELKFDF